MLKEDWENLASLLSLVVGMLALGGFALGILKLRWIEIVWNAADRLAGNKRVGFVLIAIFSLGLNAGIALHRGIPMPLVHDEFSYLLAADTFAHGRLTNPTPPFFEHFESPHELVRPTRMSKYPPGQGLFLMLGQILFAKPIVGVWLSTAAACMATYWMLIEFVPSPWALTGGLFSAANPVVLEWSQTYWGGSVAMLGGALLVGAWGRLFRQTSWSASITFGAGLIILANSRPFEGLVLCVPLTISLLVHARGRLAAIVFPNLALLVLGLVWMAYYNHRITGNALRMPFVEYTLQYDRYPKFWFLPLRPMPVLRNQALQWVHLSFEMGHYPLLRTFSGFFVVARYRLDDLIFDNLGLAALLLPFTASFALAGNPRVRWLLIALAVFLLGLLSETFQFPHYTAPATPVILLLTILGAGQVAKWEWRKPQFGRRLMSTIVIGSIAGIAMCVARPLNLVPKLIRQQQVVEMKAPLHTGRHLVFVGYAPLHEFYVDYVYNPANLQDSRIIWARYFGPDKDLPVAKYFTGRQVWVLDADKMKLTPYLEHRPNTGPQTQEIH